MAIPQTAAPSLNLWQWSFNGYVFGDGCTYDPDTVDGFGVDQVRSGDIDRPREHGQLAGLDLLAGRDLTFQGGMAAGEGGTLPAIQSLASVMVPAQAEQPLWVNLPDVGTVCAMVRPRRLAYPTDLSYSLGIANVAAQFHATDPRIYAPPSAGFAVPGGAPGGLTFPLTFPMTFTSGSVAGSISVPNLGNIDSRPLLIIQGPVTNPVILCSAGWELSITNPFQTGYTVLAGDALVVDTDLHSVTYYVGGVTLPIPTTTGASRRSWVVAGSTWPSTQAGIPGLAPGSNTIQFTSSDASPPGGHLVAVWSSAYLF